MTYHSPAEAELAGEVALSLFKNEKVLVYLGQCLVWQAHYRQNWGEPFSFEDVDSELRYLKGKVPGGIKTFINLIDIADAILDSGSDGATLPTHNF